MFSDILYINGAGSNPKGNMQQTVADLLIVITGKSGAGKTTLMKELNKSGVNTIVPTTTRKIRHGELQGIDYNFIKDEEFIEDYFSLIGGESVKYGVDKNKLFSKGIRVVVTGRSGVDEISGMIEDSKLQTNEVLLIYLDFSNDILKKRLLARGDSVEVIEKRITKDDSKFSRPLPKNIPTIKITEGDIQYINNLVMYQIFNYKNLDFILDKNG